MHILALDRGSKKIGVAWMDTKAWVPLPLGYLSNSPTVYSDMASLMVQYHIDMVVYGCPTGNDGIVRKIESFIQSLRYCVSSDVVFQSIDEHYSSTQASDRTGDFDKKHISQDTVSAMILLERW